MPTMTVCHRHRALIPAGERCPQCERARAARNAAANVRLGRSSKHWRRLSAIARAVHVKTHGAVCPGCGVIENQADPSSKLTVDLIGGGDHARATLQQIRVLCRRCHGRADGGRRVA